MKVQAGVPQFLRRALLQHRALMVLSILCALLMVASSLATFDLVRKLFDEALRDRDMSKALQSCAILVGIFFFSGVVTFGHRYYLRLATERVAFQFRSELFNRMLVFSQAQLSRYSSGRMLGHIVNDVGVVSASLHVVGDLILSPQMVFGIMGYLLYLNWKLTIFCLLTIPPVAWIGKHLGGSARRNQARIQDALVNISSHIVDSIRGHRTAHAFHRSHHLRDDFLKYNESNLKHSIKVAVVDEVVAPLTKFITAMAGAAIISFGAYLVIVEKQLSEGELIAFLTAAGGIIQPLRQLNQVNVRLNTVFAAVQRIKEVLEEELDTLAKDQAALLQAPAQNLQPGQVTVLEFRDIGFHYPERSSENSAELSGDKQSWVFRHLNTSIKGGESVAFVGSSGSGKSTLSLLALRFLDPQLGGVFLNGKDAREISLEAYRSHFSYVSQDIHLFQKSLRENMRFAKLNATDEEIWKALEDASIADFVRSLPHGLDTDLGEQASKISGGERQRFGIARAFLRNAPILILDEITSQLDSKSEQRIQGAMKRLFQGRTVLIIAHRLSTIMDVNRVVVLESGKIVEEGDPRKLAEDSQSAFGKLWRAQNRFQGEAENR